MREWQRGVHECYECKGRTGIGGCMKRLGWRGLYMRVVDGRGVYRQGKCRERQLVVKGYYIERSYCMSAV